MSSRATTRAATAAAARAAASRSRALSIAARIGRRLGVDVVRRGYSSPMPDLDRVDPSLWAHPSPMPGVELDLERQFRFLEGELGQFVAEFGEAVAAGRIEGFDPANRMYGPGDADALYAIVRRLGPARVVEVGSGHSTLIIAAALGRNAQAGHDGRLVALDPAPRRALPAAARPWVEHRAEPVEAAPSAIFDSLRANDVLFIDSSHVSRLGGDVNRIVLEVLPQLAPGVLVHFHDVFLPWEYPRRLAEREDKFWNEQYLLHAFLIGNEDYEVVLGLHALTMEDPARAAATIPALGDRGAVPGAFWIRRRNQG